jgi:hypothetical protein
MKVYKWSEDIAPLVPIIGALWGAEENVMNCN